MLDENIIKKVLISEDLTTKKGFTKLTKEARGAQKDLEDYLVEQKIISETTLYQKYAELNDLPFVPLKDLSIRQDILELIPEPIASNHEIIAFETTDSSIKVATLDPGDLQTQSFIKKKTGLEPEVFITTPSAFRKIFKLYHKNLQSEFDSITAKQSHGDKHPEDTKDLEALASDLPVVHIIDSMLEYAIFEEASDIHIEPEEANLMVRMRIDGILRSVMTLPKKVASGLVARIKILSNLKIDEHRLPQDGRFKISNDTYNISFRVSVIPVYDGEKIVLRLLNESGNILTLEQLGMQTQSLEALKRNITKPHGMILVTGPTGSGKTTSLYTILNILNTPDINITTIEDPIEYRMPHVNQSQVNPKIGYTFAAGLRAFLRQDPDIILVGEIRDTETAEISVNAAMTGHLVLSTLHTNDAATTLPRLKEMNVQPFLISSTTNIIIAQRLVRRICMNCIYSYKLDKKTLNSITHQFDVPGLLKAMTKAGSIASEKDSLKNMLFYQGKGCAKCNQTGYKGRIGIYEALEVTEEIAKMVIHGKTATEIMAAAIKAGMITVAQDGFIKAKNGITTIEEVMRVTKV